MSSIFDEIQAERRFQDERWGGPAHDDTHTLNEWAGYMRQRVDALEHSGTPEARRELVELAALAVAVIESLDRKAAKP